LLADASCAQLLNKLRDLNNDFRVHAILVQMPLDSASPIDERLVTNAIDPQKDVDGSVWGLLAPCVLG
jgi:methylenetetrahydrofolate dehydrogenase (NADP+)/methenyltetrahydrofolate cyclohydrolase/formyltetrahydrofolate synthetase